MLSCCSARPYIRLPKSSFELSKLSDLRTDQLARSLFFAQSIPSPSIWSFSLPLLCRERKHSTRLLLENSDFQFYLILRIGKLQTRRKN
jgi:hypothetical protein